MHVHPNELYTHVLALTRKHIEKIIEQDDDKNVNHESGDKGDANFP